jgi:hypothetical protein
MREKRIPMLHSDMTLDVKLSEIIERYKKLTQYYQQITPLPVSANSEALEILDKYEIDIENQILKIENENPSSLWKLYISETPYMLLKMATIRRLTREPLPQKIVIIERNDVEKAMNDLNIFLESANQVVTDVEHSATPSPVITEEKEFSRAYNIIKRAGEEGIMKSDLLITMQISRDRLSKIIETLFEQNRIIVVKTYSTSRGRRGLKFFTNEYRYRAIREGEIIDDIEKLKVYLE